jgi:hypothetical protein
MRRWSLALVSSLVALVAVTDGHASRKYKGGGGGGGGGGSSKNKPSKPEKPSGPPILVAGRTTDFPLHLHPVRVSVLGRSETSDLPFGILSKTRALGRAIARTRAPLITGGGHGVPKASEREAFEAGGETWAIPPSFTALDFLKGHSGPNTTTVVYPTGTGGGSGSIEREAPLVQLSNIRTYVNGGPGTFGELIAGLHAPGVLALLADSGGVAGNAMKKILPFIGVPKNVRVVTHDDPDVLYDKARTALRELEAGGVSTLPKQLYIPRPHRSVLSSDDRKGRNVMAFLVDDGGLINAADKAKTMELADHALSRKVNGKPAVAILAGGKGVPDELGFRAVAQHDIPSFIVTGNDGPDTASRVKGKPQGAKMRTVNTGKGDGVGHFALHREVVEDADVVFVTSAQFKNLSGLAFAMRQSNRPVIAVLELGSTGSDHLLDILKEVDRKFADRVIVDRDPKRLMDRVEERLRPPPPPPPKVKKDKGESSGGFKFRVPFEWEKEEQRAKDKGGPGPSGGSKIELD